MGSQGPTTNLGINEEDLPASFCKSNKTSALPACEWTLFLDADLSVQQLNRNIPLLWVTGKPYLPRPLSSQKVLGRTLIPTIDVSLHLVWTSQKIYIKALPRYVLAESFYHEYLDHLRSRGPDADVFQPHGSALGFLHSYVSLMPTELDFAIAREAHLVPEWYTWVEWRKLVKRMLKEYGDNAIWKYIPVRYRYGELRLSRLDKISRFWNFNLLQGYSALTGTQRYVEFLAENLGIILAATGYIVVILTAMQVALAANDDPTLKEVCYRFSIFSMVFPLIAVCFIMSIFVIIFTFNWRRTLTVQKMRFGEMGVDWKYD